MNTNRPELIIRILDVNFNRAREAIRVIEDYTRFVLNNKSLTTGLRDIRHSLVKVLSSLPRSFLSARNVSEDIGCDTYPDRTSQTSSVVAVVLANFKRLEESLRSLAEYLKTINRRVVQTIEKIRFRVYELEQQLTFHLEPKKALDKVRLYVLISSNITRRPILDVVRQVIKGGADAIQLREKKLSDDKLIRLIREIRAITLQHRVLFIVNDRADLAWLGQADGVHLGKDDISVRQARQILGADKMIGATTHNIKEALAAQKDGADYISVGPMFVSPTKQTLPPRGLSYLKEVARRISIPYVAIGGINQANLPVLAKRHKKLFKCPVKAAISSGIIARPNPTTASRHIKKILTRYK